MKDEERDYACEFADLLAAEPDACQRCECAGCRRLTAALERFVATWRDRAPQVQGFPWEGAPATLSHALIKVCTELMEANELILAQSLIFLLRFRQRGVSARAAAELNTLWDEVLS